MLKTRLYSVLLLGLLGLTASAATTAAPQSLPVLDRMVASVNDEAITESELKRQTELLLVRLRQTETPLPALPVLHKQLLEKMIMEKLQLQLAAAEGIEVDEKTLNQAIQEIASRDGLSVSQMQEFLVEQGIPVEQFRQTIKTELTLSKIQQKELGHRINISKTEVEHFLKSPAGQDHSGVEYRLGHILIPLPESPSAEQLQAVERQATAIVKELKAGADFAKVAIAKSAGQQALSGGDLGWRQADEVPTIFAKLTPTLRVGEVYGPIRDASGFHIIKLLSKRSIGEPSESNAKGDGDSLRHKAMEKLYQRKFEEILVAWLRRLRSDAEIKIYLNET